MIQVLVQHSLNVPFLLVILCFSVSPCWVSHKNDATTIMSIKVLTLSCLRVVAHQHQSTRSIITIFLKFPYLRKVFYFCLFFNENLLLFVDSLVYFLRTLPLFYALVNEPIWWHINHNAIRNPAHQLLHAHPHRSYYLIKLFRLVIHSLEGEVLLGWSGRNVDRNDVLTLCFVGKDVLNSDLVLEDEIKHLLGVEHVLNKANWLSWIFQKI